MALSTSDFPTVEQEVHFKSHLLKDRGLHTGLSAAFFDGEVTLLEQPWSPCCRRGILLVTTQLVIHCPCDLHL